jgi:hypothetical protein
MPDECRMRAQACLASARSAIDPQKRGLLLRLAVEWMHLAEYAEICRRLRPGDLADQGRPDDARPGKPPASAEPAASPAVPA